MLIPELDEHTMIENKKLNEDINDKNLKNEEEINLLKEENNKLNEKIKTMINNEGNSAPLTDDFNKLKEENDAIKIEFEKRLKEERNKLNEEINKLKEENKKLNDDINKKANEEKENIKLKEGNNELKENNNLIKSEQNKNKEDNLENHPIPTNDKNDSQMEGININKEIDSNDKIKIIEGNFKLKEEIDQKDEEFINAKKELGKTKKIIEDLKEENEKLKESNFKIELNNYKDKYNNFFKENTKKKEDCKNLEKEKEQIQETSNIIKNIKIINQEARSGEEQESSDNTPKNPILNKTIKDLGNGKVVETIQIITEEEVVPNQSSKKSSFIKKNINNSNHSLTNIKDIISPIKSKTSSRLFTPLSKEFSNDKIDNEAPDSEFLRKVKMYSNRKEKNLSGLKKSKTENINKKLFKRISSAEKIKPKDNKINKILERIKKSREKNSDEKGKNENNLIKYKSVKIKNIPENLVQKEEEKSEHQEINEEEKADKYSGEKSNDNIIRE